MRIFLLLMLLVGFCSAAAADDDSDHDLMLSLLEQNNSDIQILGVLKFCGNVGLRHPVYQHLSDSIVGELFKRKLAADKGTPILLAADLKASGIAAGIELVAPDAATSAHLCSGAVKYVDNLLYKQIPQRAP